MDGFYNPAEQKLSINTRALLTVALTVLANCWLIFFVIQLLWIVPADSDMGSGQARIATAGGMLFFIRFASIWLPTGLVGNGRWSLLLTSLLLGLSLCCGLALYPTPELWRYPVRLAMHLLLGGILSCWTVSCWRQQAHHGS